MNASGQLVLELLASGGEGLNDGAFPAAKSTIWTDSSIIILCLSLVSISLVVLHSIIPHTRLRNVYYKLYLVNDLGHLEETQGQDQSETFDVNVIRAMERYALKIQATRVVVCAALVTLQTWIGFQQGFGRWTSDDVLLVVYIYSTVLALCTVLASMRWSIITSRHLSLILLGAFGVYVYRDIVPLATVAAARRHEVEVWETVLRLVLLFLGGVLVPVTLPRHYHPVDPQNPRTPNIRQTASILSAMTFSYIDPIIFRAYTQKDVKIAELPSLSDRDTARYLVEKAFPYLNPVLLGRRRHLFFGIVLYFKWTYLAQCSLLLLKILNDFAAPVATLKLLEYLEAETTDSLIQPWVWILWLGFAPAISSALFQAFIYLANIQLLHVEGILTLLIMEHSFRIRVNSHTSGDVGAGSSRSGSETASISGTSDTVVGSPGSKTTSTSKKVEDQTGKVMTMLSMDLANLRQGQDWILPFFYLIRIVVCTVFLYKLLGWSALAGIGFLVLTLPIPGKVASLLMSIQREKMKRTDERLQIINQVMTVIRMIKLFAWERKMEAEIAEKRDLELKTIRKSKLIDISTNMLNSILPLASMMSVYATFTLVMKQELTASVVFPAEAVFALFRSVIFQMFGEVPGILRAKISLDRINDYLSGGELFDGNSSHGEYCSGDSAGIPHDAPYFRDAVFTWSKPGATAPSPGSRNYRLHIDGELLFRAGKVNMICGPTGCGKTSMLMALLGEMYFNPIHPSSMVYLPRVGGVSYAAQESWVMNDTIKQNVMFQTPYDEERYQKVIYQTDLTRDLELLDAGDMTEVGERGITLSGGQKARLTLARAVYSHAQTVLLDDVLSALDVHTAQWVAEKCLGGDLLRGRTVLLVTHNVLLGESISDYVVSIGLDGKITSRGSVKDALNNNSQLCEEISRTNEEIIKEDGVHEKEDSERLLDSESDSKKGKLIVSEEIAIGHVSWKAVKLFFSNLGGVLFYSFVIPVYVVATFFPVILNWFLGYWASQYELHPHVEVPVKKYLSIYGALLIGHICMQPLGQATFFIASIRASRSIHAALVRSILTSSFRWLDTVPISRVIARCANDFQTIDGMFPQYIVWTVWFTMSLIISFFTVIIWAGWEMLIPAVAVSVAGFLCGTIYMNTQLPLQRNKSTSKAPILGHISDVLTGIVVVRAYEAESSFRVECQKRLNSYMKIAHAHLTMNRWVAFRMESMGGYFGGVVAAWLIYGRRISAGSVGFTLTVLVFFTDAILVWVRVVNETEVQANSLEQILQYLEIDHERQPSKDGTPPAYWPASGEIVADRLSARYSVDGPRVLKDLSFRISSGERVGVVGRTGSGKSTVALALLCAIPIEGNITSGGRDLIEMNLDSLRSKATIIPQHPELLSGTLRENLDPFHEHDDAVLNSSLRAAGLFYLQEEGKAGGITLDTEVHTGGSNFSQGQRQIIALARAVVRQSKLLILDEATAAIDYETDQAIQKSIRTEFTDATVITIAHRLKTIMDSDKIMVLDAGELVQYDTPQHLLSMKTGLFYNLVEGSSDRTTLYELAGFRTM